MYVEANDEDDWPNAGQVKYWPCPTKRFPQLFPPLQLKNALSDHGQEAVLLGCPQLQAQGSPVES